MLENFYAGDKTLIAEQWESTGDLESARFVKARADFSLHLEPDWFDDLVAAVCRSTQSPSMGRVDVLIEQLAGDGEGSSADVVSPTFVKLVADLSGPQLKSVAKDWLGNELTDDATAALAEFVRLCGVATVENLPVVHTWSM